MFKGFQNDPEQHSTSNRRMPRILTFDGGGVRALSSLLILRGIMSGIESKVGAMDLRPCEYFDLIGGTDTGGLIAVMLGALGMVKPF
jgi:patatin-like phospholipase/acyl hydrolase